MAESTWTITRAEELAAERTKGLFWISTLRVLAALAVVFLHTAYFFVVSRGGVEPSFWWFGNTIDSAVRWCVPVFVMISGALLLDPNRDEDGRTFAAKRAKRILIPLVFWTIIYLGWRIFLDGMALRDVPSVVLEGIPFYHMWYLYMIPGLYLATPFLRTYIRGSSDRERWVLVIFLLLLAAVNAAVSYFHRPDTQSIFSLWIPYVAYYLAGDQLRTLNVRGVSFRLLALELVAWIGVTALGTGLLVGSYGAGSKGLYFYDYMSPTVIASALIVFVLGRQLAGVQGCMPAFFGRLIRALDPATLGIYVVHALFLGIFERLGYLDPARFNPVIGIPAIALAVFACAYVTTRIFMLIPGLRNTVA